MEVERPNSLVNARKLRDHLAKAPMDQAPIPLMTYTLRCR